jgi:hypothetical protein
MPPFFVRFEPTNVRSNKVLPPPHSWELEAVGEDQNGNLRTRIVQSTIEGFPIIPFPTSVQMSISIMGQGSRGIIDGSPCTLNVNLSGQSNTLNLIYWGTVNPPNNLNPNPTQMSLYANGIYVTDNLPTGIIPTLDTANNVMQLDYRFAYNPSFINHAKPDGKVRLTGNLVYQSPPPAVNSSVLTNDLEIEVIPPTPWADYKTALLSIRNDLLGSDTEESSQGIINGIAAANAGENAFFNWVAQLTNNSSFQRRVDLNAAYHIIHGQYYPNFPSFNEEIQNYIVAPNNPQIQVGSTTWYKRYIDDKLQGNEYQGTFGQIPFLIGDFTLRNVYDYSTNRLNLISQFMANKWGQVPDYSQKLQGSKKLLNYWSSFQENYWESLGRDDGLRDTPPRRDGMTTGGYISGELAVELVWQLASEVRGVGNLPWIFYTNDLRGTKYTTATALALLFKNKWDFSAADVNNISNLSTSELFKYIINDIRYQSRYFLIWKFAQRISGSLDLNGSTLILDDSNLHWKKVDWFGTFNDESFPWIYHSKLGWLFHGSNTTASMYLYSTEFKTWIWTNDEYFEMQNGKAYIRYWVPNGNGQESGKWTWLYLDFKTIPNQILKYFWLEDVEKWIPFSDL